ncbi:MAG: HD domain-containing phosphohydrolase, partial [Geminicoccaceae bacterium]
IQGKLSASRRLTESELVRLFVTDVDLFPAGKPLPRSIRDQRPYFQQLMADFTKQHELARSAIINRDGRVLLSSPGSTLRMKHLLSEARMAPAGWQELILPVRAEGEANEQLVIDLVAPMPKVQSAGDQTGTDAFLLVLTVPVSKILQDLLKLPDSAKGIEALHLLQQAGDEVQHIGIKAGALQLVADGSIDEVIPGESMAFRRRAASGELPTYALGEPVQGVSWTIVHTIDAAALLAPARRFQQVITGIAVFIVLTLALGFAALWWRRSNDHHQELVTLYQDLAGQLEQQRRFLASITGSISDWLSVSGTDGRCIYVNPAFASGLGQAEELLLGRSEAEMLPSTENASLRGDFQRLIKDEDVNAFEIAGKQRFLSTSVSDLNDRYGNKTGNVTIFRDRTEVIEQRGHRLHGIEQTIDALIQLVERRDPFLLGHSRRLRSYGIAVGRTLGLDGDNLAALALAASLSQIGKVFIPDDVLVKPGRHDRQEAAVMRGHIVHALCILERVDFQLPVAEILGQMHERLDGSGYPHGLVDDDVGMPARILGVVDVFCARTAPRSYRDRLSPGQALYHLAKNTQRYDLRVIGALAEIAAKEGELDEASELETTFLDARIWQRAAAEQPVGRHVAA